MPSAPWADTPFPLIETPSKTRSLKTSHYSVECASRMTHVHNVFLRILNSIYHQAPHVHAPTDIRDLLFYGNAWFEMVEHHHHFEETAFFPAIEKMTGTPGLMEKNVEQHHAFHPGFFTFRDYCRDTTPEKYDAKKLLGIMDSFAVIFRDHLADEIDTLLALDHCDGAKLKAAYKEMEKKITAASDKYTMFPIVFGVIDHSYEGGIHKGVWPPIPGFVHYVIMYWYGRRHAGSWRFSPCDGYGNPRPLMFV